MRTSQLRHPARSGPMILGLLGVVVMSVVVAPAYAQSSVNDPPTIAESVRLTSRLNDLNGELGSIETATLATTAEISSLHEREIAMTSRYDIDLRAKNLAIERLSQYAVSAYIGANLTDGNSFGPEVVDNPNVRLDAGRRHMIANTVRSELLAGAHRRVLEFDGSSRGLDQLESDSRDAKHRLDDLVSRATRLRSDVEATQLALNQARVDEAAAARRARAEAAALAAEQARARRLDLRANVRRPESVHSGVVPSATVPPAVLAKIGDQIPPTALDAYWRAAKLINAARPDCGIDWALIAGIGEVETRHGTYGGTVIAPDGSTSPTIVGIALDGSGGTARIADTDGGRLDGDTEFDRAVGPMQFIPSTWMANAADGNGDGVADPHNVYDAAAAAGGYLCNAAGGNISVPENASRAVYAYNRSLEYNVEVLTNADNYRRLVDPNLATPSTQPPKPPSQGPVPPPASPGDPTVTTSPTSPTSAPVSTTTTTVAPPASTTTTAVRLSAQSAAV